jgi:hypothetical protein
MGFRCDNHICIIAWSLVHSVREKSTQSVCRIRDKTVGLLARRDARTVAIAARYFVIIDANRDDAALVISRVSSPGDHLLGIIIGVASPDD